MKTAILMVILCSCLSSCAMSVNHDKLIEGVSRLSPIEEVEIIVTISPWETEYYCHKHSIGLVWGVINCAINACFVPACAVPLVDKEGVIRKCYIYAWAAIDALIDHEKDHCRGKPDLLY